MKNLQNNSLVLLAFFISTLFACEKDKEISSFNPVNWNKRSIELTQTDSLIKGSTYLSVYSEIYSMSEHRTHTLTATVSMRNISSTDTVYVFHAEYYNTKGDLIRTYFDKPIFLQPLETVEIIIDEDDKDGGTGANFIFDWATKNDKIKPYFEAVMISESGQQGISFTTQGIKR
ncbi:DUF3124 domain-containing protein [Chondrinema litorale]|uniref:DUF3124 domain-containing protein n=1 Tax=Chondrinema litorale TaxID=2994555 RepID=UPI0025437415|nr:DUF3124 domain-containing protein [Chondrinema litorale]UZR93033.1 DUF3124 domain-containing protein [Chondrinema litorale]